jgi:hypothetical protein
MPVPSNQSGQTILSQGGAEVDPLGMESPEYQPPGVGQSYSDPRIRRTAQQPFSTKPGQSIPVWQRASSDWTAGLFLIPTNPFPLLRNVIGRYAADVWVPASLGGSAPNGVAIGPDPGPLQTYYATGSYGAGMVILNAGDSLAHYCEASMWVICQNGNTTGYVQFVDYFNPAVLDPSMEG